MAIVVLILVKGISMNGDVDGTWTGAWATDEPGAGAPVGLAAERDGRSDEVIEPKRPLPFPTEKN